MSKMKKIIATLLAVAMMASIGSTVMADDSAVTEIINYISEVNRQMGVSMSEDDLRLIEESVIENANQYCQDYNVTMSQAYSRILEEVKAEAPLGSASPSTRSSGLGDTPLPRAERGYIFYTDNDFAFNHSGMYTAADRIVESMPQYGVHHASISDETTYQSCASDIYNNSCILSVSGATATQYSSAINWALTHEGKSYDINFVDNKANTASSNGSFNCSELVWKAFKFTSGIDLDSNGGLAVYPNNIKDSGNTIYYKGF